MTKSLVDITQINYRYQRSARIDHDNSMYVEDVLLPIHLRCVKIERK